MMSVTYKFTDMAAMADYFDNKAREKRESAEHQRTQQKQREMRAAAAELESVAHMVRNTVIGTGQ